MAENFENLHDVRARLKQIVQELNRERLAGWPKGPSDFHMRRLQVFCELVYTDLVARTEPELVRTAEEAVRLAEQEAIGKTEPPYTPPPDAKQFYQPILERERNFVAELEAMAAAKKR